MKKIILSLVPLLCLAWPVLSQNGVFNADSAYQYTENLSVKIGPRIMGSTNEARALEWTIEKFRSFGADTTFIMHFNNAQSRKRNYITQSGIAVGIFKGESDTAIVVGGHIDSEAPETPGANDNASGTAATIELARIWSQRPLRYTMIFCAFGGEERGLLGSGFFVDHYEKIDHVGLMISTDMAGSQGMIETLFERKDLQAPIWLVKDALKIRDELGLDRLSYPTHIHALLTLMEDGPGSDHESFLAKGIPAIDFTSGIIESPIHSAQDRMAFIDKTSFGEYGRFVDKLLQKYQQHGIPDTQNNRYVLWEPLGLTLFIPYWSLYIIIVLAFVLALFAFDMERRHRRKYPKGERVRFSGSKLLLLLLLIFSFAHLGEWVIQLIKGLRYPWIDHVTAYLVLNLLWLLAGIWVMLRLSRRWKFSDDPYVYSKRVLLLLFFALAGSLFLSARVAVYPALTLLLVSLALLIRQPALKAALILIAPIPVYRLFFHEEIQFIYNSMAFGGIRIDSFLKSLIFNGFITLFLLLISLPLLYAYSYMIINNATVKSLLRNFRRPLTGFVLLAVIAGYSAWLITLPDYNGKRRPVIRVDAEYRLPEKTSTLIVAGNEYFKDVTISSDSLNAQYTGRRHKVEIPQTFAADWIEFNGTTQRNSGVADTIEFDWMINSDKPWLQVNLELLPDSAGLEDPQSKVPFYHEKEGLRYHWYGHYQDSIHIRGSFTVANDVGVIRRLWARYDVMPVHIEVRSQLADVSYRTTIFYEDTLRTLQPQ